MTAWWSGSAVLFDLETDGVDPIDARIITACIAPVRPGGTAGIQGLTTWLARPERDIPAEATSVHGITTEHAREYGGLRENVIAGIAHALGANARLDTPVIGHNVGHYDLTLLDREMRRTSVGSLGVDGDLVTVRIDGRQVGAFHVIDTLCLDKAVDPYRKGSRKLVDTAAHYGVPIRGEAHSADADALAAGRIAWAIAKRADLAADYLAQYGQDPMIHHSHPIMRWYGDRRTPHELMESFANLSLQSLPELHALQVGWAAGQAAGLAEYFRRTGEGDPDGVRGAWPLEPIGAADAVTDAV